MLTWPTRWAPSHLADALHASARHRRVHTVHTPLPCHLFTHTVHIGAKARTVVPKVLNMHTLCTQSPDPRVEDIKLLDKWRRGVLQQLDQARAGWPRGPPPSLSLSHTHTHTSHAHMLCACVWHVCVCVLLCLCGAPAAGNSRASHLLSRFSSTFLQRAAAVHLQPVPVRARQPLVSRSAAACKEAPLQVMAV